MQIKLFISAAAIALSALGILSSGGKTPTTLAPAAQDALDVWLDRLEEFECSNCGDNFKKIDTNGKYSYGCLQFQAATFIQESKKYHMFPEANNSEIMNFIDDCPAQKQLARSMLLADNTAWQHWYTSVVTRGLGKPPVMRGK